MLANLRALFGVFVDIVLLRRGPEHLPASPLLLVGIVVVNLLAYGVVYSAWMIPLMKDPPANWPLQLVAGALITLLWFKVSLQLAGKAERFVQCMIAMFAANTMFLAAMPLVVAFIARSDDQDSPLSGVLLFLLVPVSVWALAVLTRIVSSTFEWPWIGSLLFLIVSNLGGILLLSILFSALPATG